MLPPRQTDCGEEYFDHFLSVSILVHHLFMIHNRHRQVIAMATTIGAKYHLLAADAATADDDAASIKC